MGALIDWNLFKAHKKKKIKQNWRSIGNIKLEGKRKWTKKKWHRESIEIYSKRGKWWKWKRKLQERKREIEKRKREINVIYLVIIWG